MGVMDAALEILKDTAPEYCGGMVNHGPMVAEAMIALGRPDAVIDWIGYYRRRLQPRSHGAVLIILDNWSGMLGNRDFGAWYDFFDPITASTPVSSLLKVWVPRLAPGISAAGLHGLIRTGHAVRSLVARQTPLRKRELAAALAYWASHYQSLPGNVSGRMENLAPRQAIRRIVPIGGNQQKPYGVIERKLQSLENHTSFEDALFLLDTSTDLNRLLSELTEIFAGICLANARDISTATALMHTVTAPAMLRVILPCLDRTEAERALLYLWQACASFYALMGDRILPETGRAITDSQKDLIERAMSTADEHAIKFTEACLREYALHPEPVYLQAARDAVERISELSELTSPAITGV